MKLYIECNCLTHYGVPGMRWGHRKKYLNADGSLNKLGQARKKYEEARDAENNAYNEGGYDAVKWQKNIDKKSFKRLEAEIEYSKAMQKNPKKAERIEKSMYGQYLKEEDYNIYNPNNINTLIKKIDKKKGEGYSEEALKAARESDRKAEKASKTVKGILIGGLGALAVSSLVAGGIATAVEIRKTS